MDKQKLLTLLKDPNAITSEDGDALMALQKEYPYFSIAYALDAKLKKQTSSSDAKKALGVAALYTADRHILKGVVNSVPVQNQEITEAPTPEEDSKPEENLNPPQEATPQKTGEAPQENESIETATQPTEEVTEPKEEVPGKTETIAKASASSTEDTAASESSSSNIRRIVFDDTPSNEEKHLEDSFYQEVEDNLKNLTAQKEALNRWMDLQDGQETASSEHKPIEPTPSESTIVPPKNEATIETPDARIAPTDSSQEEHLAPPPGHDIPKEPKAATPPPLPSEAQPTPPPLPPLAQHTAPPPLPKGTGEIPPEQEKALINQVEERNVTPQNEAQREQAEMIDRFLAEEKQLSKKATLSQQDNQGTQEDLSLKSQEFSDNIVSENLARIFTKQGKTDRAIEIYRKLIWKFPQKRGYFADLIEQLKDSQ